MSHWKTGVVKDLDRALRDRHRVTVAELVQAIAAARAQGRAELKLARERAGAKVRARAARADDWYRKQILSIRARRSKVKTLSRAQARAVIQRLLETIAARLGPLRDALDDARRYGRTLRSAKSRGGAKGRQAKHPELDEAVESELAAHRPELIPLWRKVKKQIRGSDRWSRHEEFMHFVHEHQDEVHELLQEDANAYVRQLEREQLHHYRGESVANTAPDTGNGKGGWRGTKRLENELLAEEYSGAMDRVAGGEKVHVDAWKSAEGVEVLLVDHHLAVALTDGRILSAEVTPDESIRSAVARLVADDAKRVRKLAPRKPAKAPPRVTHQPAAKPAAKRRAA
jgi:hypothetical protein